MIYYNSIKILSSDQSVGSHDLQPASDDWQPVMSNKSNNPKRRKKKKKGKASSQNQQLQMERNDIDPFHVRENVSKLEDKRKEI